MTDDLRTRIAAASVSHADYVSGLTSYCTCGQWSGDSTGTRIGFSGDLADAVIRELDDDYILVPKSHTVARWIPEWIFDERT